MVEGERSQDLMPMNYERSKPLHNFSMPCLKWGNQRLLRCKKVNSSREIPSFDRRSSASEAESEAFIKDCALLRERSSSSFESFRIPLPPIKTSGRKSKIERDGDDEIDAIGEKLMFHLRTAAEKMKFSIPEEGKEEESSDAAERPWNLRKKRAACKAPDETLVKEEQKQKHSPNRSENFTTKLIRLRGLAPDQCEEKKERRKFSISLSRDEIEVDFVAMMGKKPSRRPKKRTKIIQKKLDTLFPGLWLSEITEGSYQVPDEPETRKK